MNSIPNRLRMLEIGDQSITAAIWLEQELYVIVENELGQRNAVSPHVVHF